MVAATYASREVGCVCVCVGDFGARLVHNALLCGSMLSGQVLDGGSHLCEQRSRMCVCVGGWVGGGDTWAYTTSKRIRFEMHANC